MSRPRLNTLMVIVLLAMGVEGLVSSAAGYSFQSPQLLQSLSNVDSLPSALQAIDGTLWVAWESFTRTAPIVTNIYYETFNGVSWSPIQTATSSSTSFNAAPSLAQLFNGTILLFWSTNTTGRYNIFYKPNNSGVWGKSVQLTSCQCDDLTPKAVLGKDLTLWVFWERQTFSSSTSCLSGICRQIFYKTLQGNTWSGETQLTFDATWNVLPGAALINNGAIWVAYAKWSTSGSFYQLFYRIFSGVWSSELTLTTVNVSTFGDQHPAFVQDRNGTIWLFFDREMKLTTGIFQSKLFYKFSGDLGATWSADTQLTFGGDANTTIDDVEPSAVQGVDKSVWVFYSSDATGIGSSFDIYYIKTNTIFPVHNVVVTKIQASPSTLYPGTYASIGQSPWVSAFVTVSDIGDFPENVQVTLTAVNTTSYVIGTLSGAVVAAGGSVVLTFNWNTTGVKPGRYGLKATITQLPGETIGNTGDNTLLTTNLVHILPLGDMNQDGTVNIIDASILAFAYGSTPGTPRWNPYADINGNGIVDIIDASIMARNYGIIT